MDDEQVAVIAAAVWVSENGMMENMDRAAEDMLGVLHRLRAGAFQRQVREMERRGGVGG